MNLEEIKEILRHEEERRRREVKRKQRLILELMQEPEMKMEQKGKLWGERSLSELIAEWNGDGDGPKWETDFEARLFFHARTPERAVIVKEAFELARKVILKWWTEKQWRFFCLWLETSTWEELALEILEYTPRECVDLIKELVSRIRAEAGTNPEIFPFVVRVKTSVNRKIRNRIAYKRMLLGDTTPADSKNRIYLTPEERMLSVDDLRDFVKRKYGIDLHRATVARAKKRGWFMKPGWKRNPVGTKVFLSEEEKQWSTGALVRKYGISENTAALARERGYFYVNKQNQEKVKSEVEGEVEPRMKPVKIFLSREEMKLPSRAVAEKYGISIRTARKALRRGWFEAKHELQEKWKKEGKLEKFLKGGEDESY